MSPRQTVITAQRERRSIVVRHHFPSTNRRISATKIALIEVFLAFAIDLAFFRSALSASGTYNVILIRLNYTDTHTALSS